MMVRCEALEARTLLASVAIEDLSLPVPQTTGPYIVGIYSSRQLDASASTDIDPGETLSFAWDLDNDNIYGETGAAAGNGDEIGVTPTFFANATPKGTYSIKLKVTGSSGLSSDLTTSITIRNETINGTLANDSLRILLNAANIVDFYENVAPGGPPTFSIPYNKLIFIRVVGGDGDDVFSMDFAFPMNLNLGAGNDTFILTAGATWIDVENPWLENLILTGSASIDFRRISYRFSSLTLAGSAKVSITGTNTFLHLGSLSISDSATLDLSDKGLIVDSGDVTVITELIRSGRIKPASGAGIRNGHSAQLFMAAIVNNNPLHASFAGESNLTGGEMLVQLTKMGDLNFDDKVTIADFIDLASHFGQSPATWGEGDTNGDDVVSIADFVNFAILFESTSSAFGTPQPALSSIIPSTSAPKKHRRLKSRHHVTPSPAAANFRIPQAHWLEKR